MGKKTNEKRYSQTYISNQYGMSNCSLCKITEIFLINFWYQQFSSLRDYGGLKWSFASNTKFIIIWLYYFCSYTIFATKNTMDFRTILDLKLSVYCFSLKLNSCVLLKNDCNNDDCFFHYFLGFLYSLFTRRGPRKKQALDIGPPEKLDRHCSTMYMEDHLMLIIFQ